MKSTGRELSPSTNVRASERNKILVLTTCYPLSDTDISAVFLKTLYEALAGSAKLEITVLAADHATATPGNDRRLARRGLRIRRYHYFFRRSQTLLYGDAALSNLRKNPLRFLLLPPLLLAMFFSSLKELAGGRYTLIHAHWALPCGLVAVVLGKLFRVPVMVTSHGGDIYGLRGKISRRLLQWVFSRADLVNAVSGPVGDEIRALAPGARVEVKSMGVDEQLFRPVPGARERLGFDEDCPLLLFVGRFSEKKGVEYLLGAVAILREQGCRCRLLLVGKGNLEGEIRRMISEKKLADDVILAGMVENRRLPVYYSAADLLVVPSVAAVGGQEGLPVTVMEGLLCGCKIVTTRAGGLAELAGRKAVFFARQKDGRDLAATIRRALADDSVTPAEARKEGLDFSVAGIARDFINFYDDVIASDCHQ